MADRRKEARNAMATSDGEGRTAQRQRTAERSQAGSHASSMGPDTTSILATAALIGGVALLEPELMAGMAIGAGATLLSGWAGALLRPMIKAGVKAAYSAAEAVGQAAEDVQDLVSEARTEHERNAP
jgi:hypothetical protein